MSVALVAAVHVALLLAAWLLLSFVGHPAPRSPSPVGPVDAFPPAQSGGTVPA